MKSVAVPNEILIPQIKALIDEGHTTTFRVRGYSMRVFLEDRRDKVLLGPCTLPPRVGDVVLAEIAPKRYALHRVVRTDGEHLTLRGDGNVQGTEQCTAADVVGVARAFYRKGRTKPDLTTGLKWRLYSRLWPASPCARRWLLAAYRRLWLKLFPVRLPAD